MLQSADPSSIDADFSTFSDLPFFDSRLVSRAISLTDPDDDFRLIRLLDGILHYPKKLESSQLVALLSFSGTRNVLAAEKLRSILSVSDVTRFASENQSLKSVLESTSQLKDSQDNIGDAIIECAIRCEPPEQLFYLTLLERLARIGRLNVTPVYKGDDYLLSSSVINVNRILKSRMRKR